MNHKMILLDLDGTLLTSDSIISPISLKVLNICKLKGYKIGIITARSRSKKNIHLLNVLPCDFIAFYNGAVIYEKNHLIESNVLPYNQVHLMLQQLKIRFPNIIIDMHSEPWNYSSVCGEICHMESGDRKVCGLNSLPNFDVQRILLKSDSLMSIPLQDYMTSQSTFYYSAAGDAIIVHKKANKGEATIKAAELFDIPFRQMIAFGDDVNDIAMLNLVGTGVAMGNAVPNLKIIADYVTETNDNNGIAIWIEKHLI